MDRRTGSGRARRAVRRGAGAGRFAHRTERSASVRAGADRNRTGDSLHGRLLGPQLLWIDQRQRSVRGDGWHHDRRRVDCRSAARSGPGGHRRRRRLPDAVPRRRVGKRPTHAVQLRCASRHWDAVADHPSSVAWPQRVELRVHRDHGRRVGDRALLERPMAAHAALPHAVLRALPDHLARDRGGIGLDGETGRPATLDGTPALSRGRSCHHGQPSAGDPCLSDPFHGGRAVAHGRTTSAMVAISRPARSFCADVWHARIAGRPFVDYAQHRHDSCGGGASCGGDHRSHRAAGTGPRHSGSDLAAPYRPGPVCTPLRGASARLSELPRRSGGSRGPRRHRVVAVAPDAGSRGVAQRGRARLHPRCAGCGSPVRRACRRHRMGGRGCSGGVDGAACAQRHVSVPVGCCCGASRSWSWPTGIH